ncbi:uncharacterized protein LOC123690079 [Pieris rapae]|uniref:uncharacterized protein LOC123690079 n=1 Tax=Pieris rapae TaxID=64459 RepID=UPI001E27DD3D|nr:uncharacterized protein LOC123690079 [Pieris rapae]
MSKRNYIIALALFTAVNAFPAQKPSIPRGLILDEKNESSFSTLPLFSIFKPIIELFPNLVDIAPKIEIGDKYTNIIIKTDQYNVDEITVEVKGRYVNIEGSKKSMHDDRDLASEFLYTATLPINANTSDVYAMFYSDNYLVVTTPSKGLNTEVVSDDRKVPIIISNNNYINKDRIDDKIQDTTVNSEEVTEFAKVSTTPVALADTIITTTVPITTTTAVPDIITTAAPEITTEHPVFTTLETKEVELITTENVETSSDSATPSISLVENEAKAEVEEQTTPNIEAVTQNTTPYIENEISDLGLVTSSI